MLYSMLTQKQKQFSDLCCELKTFNPQCFVNETCGNLCADVMIIAESPGKTRDNTLIPLYGNVTGDNFEKIINNIFRRKELYITNVFPWNLSKNGKNVKPNKDDIKNFYEYLFRQIEIVDPKLIITLGLTAYQTLTLHKCSLKEVCGKVQSWNNRFLGAMYRPSPRVIGLTKTLDEMILDLKSILGKLKM